MKNYKILIISLLLLIFMVGAVSAADENVTDDNLEISDEISIDEAVASDVVEDEVGVVNQESGDNEVLGDSHIETIVIEDPEDWPDFDDIYYSYGEENYLKVKIEGYSDVDGVFSVYDYMKDESVDYEAHVDSDGYATFSIDYEPGYYQFAIEYVLDDEDFGIGLTITVYDPDITGYILFSENANNLSQEDTFEFINYGESYNVDILLLTNIFEGPDTLIEYSVDNMTYTGTTTYGKLHITIDPLPAGVHTLSIKWPSLGLSRNIIIQINSTISAADASFNCSSANKYYPMSFTDVDGTPLANEAVDVSIDGKYNYTLTTDENGTVDFLLPGLAGGDHIMTITNPVTGEKTNITITYIKEETSISTAAVTTVYNGGKYVVFTLKDSYGVALSGKDVSVVLNGKTIKGVTDANGQFKVSTDGLAPKAYTATMTFAGDDYLVKSTATAKITVKKATPKMTAKKATFKAKKKTKKYSIVLKDNKNKAMKKVKVTLKVGKKTYKATTNAKGKATFKITKLTKKGKYTAKIKFAGNKNYNAVTKKVKITVKK